MKRLLTLLAVLAAAPAFPQGFEASALAGYTTPGGIDQKAAGITDLKLEGSFTWGASVGYFFSPRFGVEGSWTRQESGLSLGTSAGSATLFDLHIDQFQGSAVYQFGAASSRIRPFLSAGLGAARLSASDLDAETKLSLGLGAGLKWMPKPKLGVRLQARYSPTYLHDSGSDYCDPFGFCQGWLQQLELTGGVVVRF